MAPSPSLSAKFTNSSMTELGGLRLNYARTFLQFSGLSRHEYYRYVDAYAERTYDTRDGATQ